VKRRGPLENIAAGGMILLELILEKLYMKFGTEEICPG
jgi:hypothetical protein